MFGRRVRVRSGGDGALMSAVSLDGVSCFAECGLNCWIPGKSVVRIYNKQGVILTLGVDIRVEFRNS